MIQLDENHSGGYGGYLTHVEIDTAHFKGNFPESCDLRAIDSPHLVPPHQESQETKEGSLWTTILPRTKLGPHRRHFFQLQNVHQAKYTHVMLTIYPDGGIKRVRVFGTRAINVSSFENKTLPSGVTETSTSGGAQGEFGYDGHAVRPARSCCDPVDPKAETFDEGKARTLPALPLSPEAFAAFGQVVQGYSDLSAVPRNVRTTSANQGSAHKFHKISLLESSYPDGVQATAGLSVYRCHPIGAKSGGHWDIKVLERHLHTNQAFIPMGPGSPEDGDQGLKETARSYLVVVAQNGKDDKPDLETMRAFITTSAQGIVYNTGIWRKSDQNSFKVTELNSRIRPPYGGVGEGSTVPAVSYDVFFSPLRHSRWTSRALKRK